MMYWSASSRLFSCLIAGWLVLALLAGGCAAPRFSAPGLGLPKRANGAIASAPEHFVTDEDSENHVEDGAQPDARSLPMFLGATGQVVSWDDLLSAAAWADVIFVGEEHDDAVGHAVERAITEDVAKRWVGSALSMEMLERDEQLVVNDFLDGIIDSKELAKLTNSENWAGEGSWEDWYQPIIDAAKDNGGTVVAANAPRRYVQLARKEGYNRIRALPHDRKAFVDLPHGSTQSPYRDRFFALMHDMSTGDEDDAGASAHHVSAEMIDAMFRSQLVWDATMAGSVARALNAGATKVVHIVGRFHVGEEGGTVLELRKRKPGARILTIVMAKGGALQLDEDDRNLGDIVIYTGARPTPKEEEKETPPTKEAAPAEAPTEETSPAPADPESQPTNPPTDPDAR